MSEVLSLLQVKVSVCNQMCQAIKVRTLNDSRVMPQRPRLIGHLIITMQPVIFNSFSLTAVKPFYPHDSNIRDTSCTPVALTVTRFICTSL